MDPRAPESAAEIARTCATELDEFRESFPSPVLREAELVPPTPVSLIATESFPALRSLIPAELNAVVTSAAVPETKLMALALIAMVVLPSRVLRASPLTDESLTVMVYALPVPVSPLRVEKVVSLIVAVTTPSVFPSTRFASATLVLLLSVTASLPNPVKPPLYTDNTSDAVPVMPVTSVAVTFRLVAASTAFISAALTAAVATVIV